jgi:transcription-repair coupling factor (superfamily II helicase)
VLFGPEAKEDPARVIRLVQTAPKEFRLDGGDKIRFFRDLADPAQRIAQVSQLVEQLTG